MMLGMPILYEYNSVLENVKLAKELGLDFVELNLNFSYCRKEMQLNLLKPMFEGFGLKATLHFFDEADFGSYDHVVDAYLTLLEKYAKLGRGYVEQINIHNITGPVVTIAGNKNYIYEKEYDEYIGRLLKNLKRARSICAAYHIHLVIENTEIPPFMEEVYLAEIQKQFEFTYDIGHDNVDKDKLFQICQNQQISFREFHFHDGNKKKCHLALGTGTMDLKKYKDMAEKNNAYVVLEVKQKKDLEISVPYFKTI